jgi:hypothetical protein
MLLRRQYIEEIASFNPNLLGGLYDELIKKG